MQKKQIVKELHARAKELAEAYESEDKIVMARAIRHLEECIHELEVSQ